MPGATFKGKFFHSDIYEQAAAYAFHLCQNHPFIDGNKRTALAAALVFLDLNGVEIDDPKEDLYGLMTQVATGNRTKPEIAVALRSLASKKKQKR